MDELVTDLTLALERTDDPQSSNSDATIRTKDSPSTTPVRKPIKKRRGRKRRSDCHFPKDLAMLSEESNDSIEEALKDYIENITTYHSDSDEDSALSNSKRLSMFYRFQMSSKIDPYPLPERADSDSIAETVTGLCKRRNKRSKKLRRTIQQSNLAQFQSVPEFQLNSLGHGHLKASHSHKRSLKRKHSNRVSFSETWTRRSKSEDGVLMQEIDSGKACEPMEIGSVPRRHKHFKFVGSSSEQSSFDFSAEAGNAATAHWIPGEAKDDSMSGVESDSETSSGNESEGFFTNDEGRLADDEQEESSFEHDVPITPWWDDDKQTIDDDEKFQNILNGVMNEYGIPKPKSKATGFQARLNSLTSMYSKESIKPLLVEMNRKLNKFVQDNTKTELSVTLTTRREREQIFQLASLYSLHCRTENTLRGRVVLIKTRNTCKPDKHVLNCFLGKQSEGKRKGRQMSEVKRARKMLLPTEGTAGQCVGPIPVSNIGNQMLRSMGWVPGTGLGPEQKGTLDPVKATLRPKGLGLGHAWPS